MAWIEITLDALKEKITGPELTALQTSALATSQPDPIPEAMERVAKEVRGYVAACQENNVGEGLTIPDELLDAALAMIVHRIATRLPSSVMLTQERVDAKNDALELMKLTARCDFALVQPVTETEDQYVITFPSFVGRTRRYRDQDGL